MRRLGVLVCVAAVVAAIAGTACTTHSPGPTHETSADTSVDAPPFTPDACKASLAAGNSASVVVGAGQTFYTAIDDGAPLTWEKGPQGGHHVWIALRLIGLRQQGTITTIDLDDVEDPSKPLNINHSRLVYDFNRDEGGHCTLPGLRMQLDNAGGPALASLNGHHIKVTATLQDPDGSHATSSRTIVVTGVP